MKPKHPAEVQKNSMYVKIKHSHPNHVHVTVAKVVREGNFVRHHHVASLGKVRHSGRHPDGRYKFALGARETLCGVPAGATSYRQGRDVRFGSLADIVAALPNVRFAPESRHHRKPSSCPLSANSGSQRPFNPRCLQPRRQPKISSMLTYGYRLHPTSHIFIPGGMPFISLLLPGLGVVVGSFAPAACTSSESFTLPAFSKSSVTGTLSPRLSGLLRSRIIR